MLAELSRFAPRDLDLMNSTAAARVNGYLGRNGSLASLESEIDTLGLSEAVRLELLKRVGSGRLREND